MTVSFRIERGHDLMESRQVAGQSKIQGIKLPGKASRDHQLAGPLRPLMHRVGQHAADEIETTFQFRR
jgi:hypothetical protein